MTEATPPRHGPAGVDVRLRRLVDVFAWLADNGGFATLDELAERFGGSPTQIQHDLVVAMCSEFRGAFPGDLIDVDVDDEGVTLRAPKLDVVARSLPRSAAYRMLIAARLVREVRPELRSPALDAAIERLSERLANASGVSLDVRVETPPSLATIQDAISAFQEIRIAYRRPYASEPSTYVVTPLRTYLDDGVWYLDARRDDGEHRTFRLQRISAVERLVADATSATSTTQLAAASTHTSGRRTVRVRIVPGAEWVVGHYRGCVERRSTQGTATEVIAVLELFDPVIARLADIAVRVGAGFAVVDDDQLAAELHAYMVNNVHRLDQLGG